MVTVRVTACVEFESITGQDQIPFLASARRRSGLYRIKGRATTDRVSSYIKFRVSAAGGMNSQVARARRRNMIL